MTRWYRAYEGTVTDPKLAEVAYATGAQRCLTVAVWHATLEAAAQQNEGGKFDLPARRVAAIFAEPVEIIAAIMAEFEAVGLVEDGAVSAWKKRQFESDSSTERSRAHRERKRSATGATPMQRCATPPYTETETETEIKKERKEGGFAFSRRVIRLKETDLKRWVQSYPLLDLPALLQNRDDWLFDQPESVRAKWFQSTSSWLAKKQSEATTALRNRPVEPTVGI